MFCLKIIQGLKECPCKRNLPDHGWNPLYSFSETYSFNKSFCFLCKIEFFVDEILRNIIYVSYYIWTLDQFQALPCSDLTVGSLRPYLETFQTPKKCKF